MKLGNLDGLVNTNNVEHRNENHRSFPRICHIQLNDINLILLALPNSYP